MSNLAISKFFKQNSRNETSVSPPTAHTSSSNEPSIHAARSNEHYETTRDGLIIFFGTAKDVSEATELLAPLKATCALMVRGLEMTKTINDNKIALLEFVKTLDTHSQYFKSFTDNIEQERLAQDFLQNALTPYKSELKALNEEALQAKKELKPGSILPILSRIGRSRIDADRFRRWNDRLGAAHKLLTISLQVCNSTQIAGASRDLKVIRQIVGELSIPRQVPKDVQTSPLERSIYGMDLDGCEPGTRTDVIKGIRQWGDDSATEKQVFWLSGQSGSGKTTVAVTMYKEWECEGRLAGRFFFSKDVTATSTTQKFCVAVARDMAAHIPSLQPIIATAIKDAPPAYFPLELQLQKMVITPVEIYGGPVFIVVDGLDSISDPQMRYRLLGCLTKELPRVPNLKVLLCSPVLPDIEEALGALDLVQRYNIYLPESEKGEIDPDITLYIERHLKNLNEDTEDQKGKGTVASLSKGYFQWLVPAAFLLKRNRNGSELMEKLTNIDSTNHSDGLYYLYLQRVVHKMWPSELKMDLLRIVITALQPISLATIHSFLPRSTHDINGVRALVNQLRGLLKVGDSNIPIRVRHSSFRDFCTDPARARDFHVDLAVTHGLLALKCLELLDPCLQHNILGIELGGVVIPQNVQIVNLDTLLKDKLSPAIAYASSYWPFHAALASRSQDLFDAVKRFLNGQLLYWAELMSWRGCIEEAIDGLLHLQTAVRAPISNAGDALVSSVTLTEPLFWYSTLGKEIDILVTQALTFVQQNKEVVEHSALQVYCSALGFAVKDASFLEHHRDAYKCPKVVVQRRFSCDTETPITNVSLLEISPDGRFIATVGRDKAIELWISSTGDPYTFRFQGHQSEVTSLAFSLDSQTLVSGSTDGQLRLWSLTTGLQIHLIQTTGTVTEIKFSPNHSYLSTISNEPARGHASVLRLWDIPPITEDRDLSVKFTCKEVFTLVTFSLDSSLLAAATEVGSFEIRSTSTGTLISSGNGVINPSSIALSPDGGCLAISDGRHIQLWDVKDVPKQIAYIVLAATERKHALSISSNGKYLLYGSTVWDVEAIPPTLWRGLRLPAALQRYAKGPGSILSYEGGWILSAHPQGPIVEIPSYYNINRYTPWRAHGSKVIFAPESGNLVLVDCGNLLS